MVNVLSYVLYLYYLYFTSPFVTCFIVIVKVDQGHLSKKHSSKELLKRKVQHSDMQNKVVLLETDDVRTPLGSPVDNCLDPIYIGKVLGGRRQGLSVGHSRPRLREDEGTVVVGVVSGVPQVSPTVLFDSLKELLDRQMDFVDQMDEGRR